MPVPSTSAEFLDLLRKSSLLEPAALEAWLERIGTVGPVPDDPKQLAGILVRDGLLTYFQSGQLLLGKHRGFTLGNYRVLERLGSGGMGTVYLCEHLIMKRRVALKVLPPERAGDPFYVGQFQREAQAVAALDHSNIVRAHDIGHDGNLHFLVMEYVDGVSLQELVHKRGPLDAARAAHYIRQGALGLEHAREAGLVHRDIKPGNLIVNRDGVIKVLDLGLALFYDDGRDTLTSGDDQSVLGTADYLAPEQAMSSRNVDTRADIYSLGATFYFLLAGSPPFAEGTVAQKLLSHQMRAAPPIRDVRPDVPEGLAEVLHRMLAKDPAERYQTPAEVAAALEPWVQDADPFPAEEELHRLSRAARSGSTAGGGCTPSTDRKSAGSTAGPNLGLSEAPTRVSRRSRTDTDPEQLVGVPAAEDPAPVMGGAASGSVPPAASGPSAALKSFRRRRLLKAGIAVGGLAVVSLMAALVWPRAHHDGPESRPAREAQKPSSASRWIVAPSGQDGTVRTVGEALARAKPGDRILVRDEVLEEAVRVPAGARDVTIEGAASSGKPVLWRAPPGHPTGEPLLQVAGVSGLHVKGFLLDGQNRLADLVVLADSCPGLLLEDLHLQGFTHVAVRLDRITGDAEHLVTLSQLRTTTARAAEAALLFTAGPGKEGRHVVVRDGRFEGPYRAAVEFDGSLAGVEFTRNRFFRAGAGFLCKQATPPHRLQLTVASNTFAELGHGLEWEALPAADYPDQIVVRDNLFLKTGRLALVDGLALEPQDCPARWVWFNEPRTGGGMPAEGRCFRKAFVVAGTTTGRAVLDVACDDAFQVWLNGLPVGQSPTPTFTKHVYHFDVTLHLKPGRNVLAVQGTNQADFFTGRPTDAGLLVYLTYTLSGRAVPDVVMSDGTWKSAKIAPPGWQQPGFDDDAWPSVQALESYDAKEGGPWAHLVWDSTVAPQLGTRPPIVLTAAGNVRDYPSAEGYPTLDALAGGISLPADPDDDARFLRYPKTSPLVKVGSPGVGPE